MLLSSDVTFIQPAEWAARWWKIDRPSDVESDIFLLSTDLVTLLYKNKNEWCRSNAVKNIVNLVSMDNFYAGIGDGFLSNVKYSWFLLAAALGMASFNFRKNYVT